MSEPVSTPPGASRETGRGIVAELLGFFSSFGRHIQSLLALAGLEAREAAGFYAKLAAIAVAALVLAIFGYFLLIFFLAFLLAMLGISWIWITLGFALLHLAGATGCVFYLKANLKNPVFATTGAEMRKDFEALKNFKP